MNNMYYKRSALINLICAINSALCFAAVFLYMPLADRLSLLSDNNEFFGALIFLALILAIGIIAFGVLFAINFPISLAIFIIAKKSQKAGQPLLKKGVVISNVIIKILSIVCMAFAIVFAFALFIEVISVAALHMGLIAAYYIITFALYVLVVVFDIMYLKNMNTSI